MASNSDQIEQAPSTRKKGSGPPPEEGLPPWMATFADMVTLLLCFFVLLLSFSNQDAQTFKMLMGSVQEALGVQREDRTATAIPYAQRGFQESTTMKEQRAFAELGAKMSKYLRARDLNNVARVSKEKSGVMLRISNNFLFNPGSAKMMPEASVVMDGIIQQMQDHPDFNVIIRGHTDSEYPEGNLYATNWELSAARAAACLRYILEHSDIHPERMKAVGYASAKPLLPSTSDENRKVNRRVEFFYVPAGNRDW